MGREKKRKTGGTKKNVCLRVHRCYCNYCIFIHVQRMYYFSPSSFSSSYYNLMSADIHIYRSSRSVLFSYLPCFFYHLFALPSFFFQHLVPLRTTQKTSSFHYIINTLTMQQLFSIARYLLFFTKRGKEKTSSSISFTSLLKDDEIVDLHIHIHICIHLQRDSREYPKTYIYRWCCHLQKEKR